MSTGDCEQEQCPDLSPTSTQEVKFTEGSESGQVEAQLAPGESARFLLDVAAGQIIEITATPSDAVRFVIPVQ